MATTLEYYKFATLATASYVRLGPDLAPTTGQVIGGAQFAELAREQDRLPTEQARYFFNPRPELPNPSPWTVLSYYGGDIPASVDPNAAADKSGFGATLFARTENGQTEKVLALRGTEPLEDGLVDVLSADLGQIGILGLALTQVVSMANYVARLRQTSGVFVRQLRVEARTVQPAANERYVEAAGSTLDTPTIYLVLTDAPQLAGLGAQSPLILPGERVRVTGHSLGGHLAYMAARLFPEVFDPQVVVFNAAGYDPTTANQIGLFDALSGPLAVASTAVAQIFKANIAAEVGPEANFLDTFANQLTDKDDARVLRLIRDGLYGDFGFTQGVPNVVSLRSEDLAPGDDVSFVASRLTGADKYGTPIALPTEENNHVIEPLMDALALQAAIEPMLGPIFGASDLVRVLEASAKDRVRSYEGFAEGLYRLFLGKDLALPDSDESSLIINLVNLGIGKGDIAARNAYHDAVLKIQDAIKGVPGLRIRSLADLSADSLKNLAINGDVDALAYRYALKNLNAFAVFGPSSLYNDPRQAGVAAHNANGGIDLFVSSAQTPAGMTLEYLTDRAAFLSRKNAAHIADVTTTLDPAFVAGERLRYADLANGVTVTVSDAVLPPNDDTTKRHVFGGASADAVFGGSFADRLYGGMGTDVLIGGKGDDYLEGGAGMDLYQYSASTILLSSTNDGDDEIRDTDGSGVIRYEFKPGLLQAVQSTVIAGAALRVSAAQWKSPDGKFTYTQQLATGALEVSINGDAGGTIRILDFDFAKAQAEGFMGIRLVDLPGLPTPGRVIEGDLEPLDVDPNTPGTQTDIDEFGNLLVTTNPASNRPDTLFGSDGQNGSDPNDNIVAGGGDDVIDAKSGDDIVQGGTGRDTIDAGTGNDLVEASANGTEAGDIVRGGEGADRLYADARFDPAGTAAAELAAALAAGESQVASGLKGDFLSAGPGSDVAIGAVGDDVLAGGAGSDILVAGAGNDFLLGDSRVRAANLDWDVTRTSTGQYPIPAPLGPIFDFALFDTDVVDWLDDADTGADTLYGGAGNDWMDGGAGNDDDFLDGGSGNDVAFGNLGNDVLLGGGGDDVLDGDHASIAASAGGDDYVDGGEGNDWIYGRGGSDILFGGGGDDQIEGNEGNDILIGGPGSDVLKGGAGKDTYVLNRGDGFDAVFDTSDTATVADASVVVLDGQITRGAIKFRPGSLIIDAGEGDGLWIEGFDPEDPLSTPVLSAIQFADGDFMSFEDVLAQGFDIDGTEGDDVIQGTAVTDRINALGGNDDIYAKAGDDTIDAGAGNDIVEAGEGNDTITTGEGADIVFGGAGDDTVVAGDGDLIIDTEGTNQLDLTAYTGLTEANLEITQYQAPDGEIYLNFHIRDDLNPGATPAVGGVSVQKGELGTFATVTVDDGAGGTVALTHAELMAQYTAHGLVYDGSGASETLIGTPFADTFFGGAGADTIQAGAGDDRIDGGKGEDVLEGGLGNDTYLLAYNGARDTVIEDGSAEPNAIHTVQLDAGIASTQVKATRMGEDLEVRLKATADALVIEDFYLQPGTWQAGWQVRDANGVATVLTDFVPVVPPAAGDWLAEEADAYRARREQVFAANRSTEGYNALGGNAFQRTEQVFDYALRSSAGSTTTRALEVQLLNSSDSGIFVSTDFLSTPLAQTSGGFDIGLPIAGASGGDRAGVSAAFGTGGAASGQGSEFIATGSGSLGLSGSSIQLGAGDYAVPVYRPKSGNAGGIRNSGGVDYSNAGFFNDSSLWELAGFQVVHAGSGGGGEFGREAATAAYFNFDQRLTVTDVVAGPESSSIFVADASVVQAGDGDDDIALGAGFFFAGPDWERALNPGFTPPSISNFVTHQGERKHNLGGFVDAGAGADTITGSFGQDTIAGGTGGDQMDGREGSDRYLLALGDTGTDSIVDRGSDQHDYYNWFYWSRGIFDWEERLDHANQWRADFDTETSYFDTEAEVDEAIANAGFHDKRFISPLPELAPAVSWNDSAMTTQLISAGVMAQDTVEFGPGISIGDLEFSWAEEKVAVQSQDTGSLEDVAYAILEISWGVDSSVRIAMPRPDDLLSFGVERFRFADGSTLSLAEMVALAPAPAPDFGPATVIEGTPFLDILSGTSRNDEVYGHEGDDTLFGGWGSDLLVGGAGDDRLSGFRGSDTYLYSPGDGNDTINDGGESAPDIDTLRLAGGIRPWDIAVERDANNLYVQVWASGETLTLEDWFANPSSRVERVEFDNGTAWSASELEARATYPGEEIVGTEGDDILIGTVADDFLQGLGGNDTLQGLQGSDGLEGGEGSDLYLYAAGDGRDFTFDEDLEADDVDTLRFAPGILPADVGVTRDEFGYYLVMDAGADQVLLDSMASDPIYEIERIEFADGTLWTPADVAARVALLPGTAFEDVLWGTAGDDTLQGLGGHDFLYGHGGNDAMAGGGGGDTYVIALGDGHDTIDNTDADDHQNPELADQIQFGEDISSADVTLQRSGDDLVIAIGAGADSVRLSGWYLGEQNRVDEIFFNGDFVSWDRATIEGLAPVTGNAAPVVANALADQAANEDSSFSFAIPAGTFSDPDAGDVLTYAATQADGSALPAWLTFDAQTQTFSGTPLQADVGAVAVKVTATDTGGLNAEDTFTLTVANVNDVPVVSAANAELLLNDSILAGALFSVFDDDGQSPAQYEFWDDVAGGGHFSVNGVGQGAAVAIPVSAADLANTAYVAGASPGTERVWVRAYDGAAWSAWQSWNMTSALHIPNAAPEATPTAATQTVLLDQSVVASSLFSVLDADGDAAAEYQFWDSTAGNGHFAVNGVEQGVNVAITVSGADLANTLFAGGSSTGSDLVWVRATDGQTYGAWKSWTMNSWPHATNAAPVADAPDNAVLRNQSVLAQSLFSVSDADGDAPTQYELWDGTAGGGYFAMNGIEQTNNPIPVAAGDLATVTYLGGADPGVEQVWVRANDGMQWGAWEPWNMTTALHIPNAAPEATPTAATQTVLLGQSVATSSLFSLLDPDGDPAVRYELWDSTAGNGHFAVNGVEQAINTAIVVNAADLANTLFVAASSTGSDQVWVRATDGQSFGAWVSWTMNSWPHLTNTAPVVDAQDATILTGEAVAAASLFTVSDADGDVPVRYELWDDVASGGYWRLNGVQQAAAAAIAVDAADLGNAEYVGGANTGSERVWVRANDGMAWGAWESWTMNSWPHLTNEAPVVTASNTTILLGQSVDASSLFSVTDADADSIAQYEFWDSTAGNGHFTVGGVEQGVNVAIGVAASQLADTDFVAAASTGSDSVWVRAHDGMAWSDWKNWAINSWPHLTNAVPVITASSSGLLRDEALPAAMFFGVSDADGDAPVQFEFWDDVNGGGYWSLEGVQQAASQAIPVTAAQLADLDYVGAANPGTEQVWVRANDGMGWSGWKNWLMATEGGMLRGGEGPDTLNGEAGPTVLQGGGGNDTLVDTDGDNLFSGGDGDDQMTGGDGDDLFAGGSGNDTINTGSGSNIIAYNAGGGIDTVYTAAGASNTLSFGGGIGYDDLSLSKDGNDLIVSVGPDGQVVFKDWYAGSASVLNLQIVHDASDEFDANSTDPLYNKKVQTFDFAGLVAEFDEALAQSPGLTSWAVTNALLEFHLSGSDDAAVGGDLAYWYGKNAGFTGISLQAAQQVLGSPGFGSDAQTLQPFSGLQEGFVKLA